MVNARNLACTVEENSERATIAGQRNHEPSIGTSKPDATKSENPLVLNSPMQINSTGSSDAQSDSSSNGKTATNTSGSSSASNSATSGGSSSQSLPTINPGNSEAAPDYKEGELLVKFKDGVSRERINSINSTYHTATISIVEQIGLYHLRISDGTPATEMVQIYQNLPEVEYAELNTSYSIP